MTASGTEGNPITYSVWDSDKGFPAIIGQVDVGGYDYITIDSIDVDANGASAAALVLNQADNFIGTNLGLFDSATDIVDIDDSDGIRITNSIIAGIDGTTDACIDFATATSTNPFIDNNLILFCDYGIYNGTGATNAHEVANFHSNDLWFLNKEAIFVAWTAGSTYIYNNDIYATGSIGDYSAIHLYNAEDTYVFQNTIGEVSEPGGNAGHGVDVGDHSNRSRVFSNQMNHLGGAGVQLTDCNDVAVYNNTIWFGGHEGTVGGIATSGLGTGTGNIVENNYAVSDNVYAVTSALSTDVMFDANNWERVPGGNWYLHGGGGGSDVSVWNAKSNVGDDLNDTVESSSGTILTDDSDLVGGGNPVGITTDVDGDSFDDPPTIGAQEFEASSKLEALSGGTSVLEGLEAL
jgi:hypothetical protein